ncbi:diguanylate cyclase [Achromobacter ruhlandii]|uniref:diguanylate cyclase n=2 Tax=Achromobacter ruhlandii TaxID=72557 RepID=UPI003557B1AB
MAFKKNQTLNEWAVMLDAIYGGSQNYAKTPYEIHAHLTEVCGVFAKHFFKRHDLPEARAFLPKIFSWTLALVRKVDPTSDLEKIVLKKFPNACPYCLKNPCDCWSGEKPTVQDQELDEAYYLASRSAGRKLNDFQLMFERIYGQSWVAEFDPNTQSEEICGRIFIRLVEELGEVSEAMRFHHLYPENFYNEISDLLAWWFALSTNFPSGSGAILVEDMIWTAYPGHCPHCQTLPCLCRPSPVRQLMSRPIPGQGHRFDSLTSLLNQGAYKEDIKSVDSGNIVITYPSACIRLDVDNFKSVNDKYGHSAGDAALQHIGAIIRGAVRERDWVYRISGDEFGILCSNYTEEEAAGAMRRVCAALFANPVKWVSRTGETSLFTVSVSLGVSECGNAGSIESAFEAADKASYASKEAGKGTVRRASLLTGK